MPELDRVVLRQALKGNDSAQPNRDLIVTQHARGLPISLVQVSPFPDLRLPLSSGGLPFRHHAAPKCEQDRYDAAHD